jgi:hypothetical protein
MTERLQGIFTVAELMARPHLPLPRVSGYVDARGRWRVWCDYCLTWHVHSPIGGPHPPHCKSHRSWFWPDGYVIVVGGRWPDDAPPMVVAQSRCVR